MYEEEEYGRTESVADTNARIISLLDLPKHLMEEMTENRRERKKIELVEVRSHTGPLMELAQCLYLCAYVVNAPAISLYLSTIALTTRRKLLTLRI